MRALKLTTRLSLFFLSALALVLAGFSATFYLFAQDYLYRQTGERLDGALNTLAAAAEIGPEVVEWEPTERYLSLEQGGVDRRVRWAVRDERDQWVDGSRQIIAGQAVADSPPALVGPADARQEVRHQGHSWWVQERRLLPNRSLPNKPDEAPDLPEESDRKHALLVLSAGISLEPLESTLRNMALLLAGVSAGLWLVAAFAGRWLCRRALLPVTQMAAAARAMEAADLGRRLPGEDNGDELADLRRSFNDLLDRLHESFDRQQRFTGDASHQLRTPLTAVLGQIEVALRRDRPLCEYQRVLTSVRGQMLHLREMVEMLLFLARADGEARLPDLQRIDLAAWLNEHLEARADRERAEDLRIEGAAGAPYWVNVQTPLLGQLLDNLLDNATKYSEPGTPVVLRLSRDGEHITLGVQDAGSGILAEELLHVFEPFYRSSRARRAGAAGVGLGLAVAERIARAFGGNIVAESALDRGSSFTLRLSAASDSPSKPACQKQIHAGCPKMLNQVVKDDG